MGWAHISHQLHGSLFGNYFLLSRIKNIENTFNNEKPFSIENLLLAFTYFLISVLKKIIQTYWIIKNKNIKIIFKILKTDLKYLNFYIDFYFTKFLIINFKNF